MDEHVPIYTFFISIEQLMKCPLKILHLLKIFAYAVNQTVFDLKCARLLPTETGDKKSNQWKLLKKEKSYSDVKDQGKLKQDF